MSTGTEKVNDLSALEATITSSSPSEDKEDRAVWYVWQCENPECKNPNTPGCVRCSRCKIKTYCGRPCQKADWKMHKKVCRKLPTKLVSWVEKIRTYIAVMRNDVDGVFEIWQDVFDEYKTSTPPLKRGVVVVDLGEQTVEPNLVLPDGSKPGKTVIKDKRSFIWKYVGADNESFLVADEYARLRHLMASYDPERQFVLMVLCSDPTEGGSCHIEEVIKALPGV